MTESLTKRLPRAARQFADPLRPSDAKWRAFNGDLRDDYGTYYEIIDVKYGSGKPAVQRQEDGSGFASYPSGKKAVCVSTHHRSRRVSAIVFSDGSSLAVTVGRPLAGSIMPKRTDGAILGTFDDWGMGKVECAPNPQTPHRGAYEIATVRGQKFVSVTNPSNGAVITIEMSNKKRLEESQLQLRLRLNNFVTIRFDPDSMVTAIDFSAEGVSHTFLVGEVYGCRGKSELKQTTPNGIFSKINLKSQSKVDTVNNTMKSDVDGLLDTLKIRTASDKTSLGSTRSMPLLQLEDTAKSLCDNRKDFTFEHKLRNDCRDQHKPMLRYNFLHGTGPSGPEGKDLTGMKVWSGKCHENAHHDQPVKIPLASSGDGTPAWDKPVSVSEVSSLDLQQMVESSESGKLLICAVVLATWAMKSSNSSSDHAQRLARAAAAEYTRRRQHNIRIVTTDLSEAGAIHSTERGWGNPLVKKYGVKSIPWLLLFTRGKCVYSERPGDVHFKMDTFQLGTGSEGLGFVSRLRYPSLAKPHFLVYAPSPSKEQREASLVKIRAYDHQLETQNILSRSGFKYEVALSAQDAQRMISAAEPAYGAVIANTAAGAAEVTVAFRQAQKRNKDVLNFLVHCWKSQGEPTEEIRRLAGDSLQCTAVFTRPLTKSALEKELAKHPVASLNYQEAGMSKEGFIALLDEKRKALV